MKTQHLLLVASFLALTPGWPAAAGNYEIDTAHSTIAFSVRHLMISTVKGNFTEFSGTIIYNEDDLTACSARVTIKTASINTANQARDNHLRNSDFFDAPKFPEITFTSTKMEKQGDEFMLTGNLTMRGVTRPVIIPFKITGKITDPWGNPRLGLTASLKINRQDFGISWSKSMDGGGLVVGDEVEIQIDLEAVQAKK